MLNAFANVFNWNSETDFDMFQLFERAAWSIVLPLATSCQFVGGRGCGTTVYHPSHDRPLRYHQALTLTPESLTTPDDTRAGGSGTFRDRHIINKDSDVYLGSGESLRRGLRRIMKPEFYFPQTLQVHE